jgi:hypothetical protein
MMVALSSFLLAEVLGRQMLKAENPIGMREPTLGGEGIPVGPLQIYFSNRGNASCLVSYTSGAECCSVDSEQAVAYALLCFLNPYIAFTH